MAEQNQPKRLFRGPHSAHSMGGKASAAKLTPEQRVERAKKASANMTPEQRVERARMASANMTPEQRAARSRMALAVRWAKRKKAA